jgi:hypothetical protein
VEHVIVIVIVTVDNLSNKSLHLIQNPLISCRVTRISDTIYGMMAVLVQSV